MLNVVIGTPDTSSEAICFSNVETHLALKGFGRGISVVPGYMYWYIKQLHVVCVSHAHALETS